MPPIGIAGSLLGRVWGAPVPLPPPVVTAAFPEQLASEPRNFDDTDGGHVGFITGTGFQSGAQVEFLKSGTVFQTVSSTFISSSSLSFIGPVLEADLYDIRVVNPDMQDSGPGPNGLHEAWKPNTNGELSCLLKPGGFSENAGDGIWTDATGNGNNAVKDLNNNPTDDGSGCPVFDGTSSLTIHESLVVGAQVVSAMATATAGTIIMWFESNLQPEDAIDYGNPALISGSGASPGIYHSASGIKSVTYDETTTLYESALFPVGTSVGERHMVATTWTDVLLRTVVDDGPGEGTVALDTGVPDDNNTGPDTWIGRSYNNTYNGTIRFVAIANTVLDDTLLHKYNLWGKVLGHLPKLGYFSPGSDVGLFTWHRADMGATLINAGANMSALADSVGDDSNKNLATLGGSADPLYTLNDANFGGQPSWGDDYGADTTSFMSSGTFASPLAQPLTSYNVFRMITPTTPGVNDYFITLNAGEGATQAPCIDGQPGALQATMGAGGPTFALAFDVTYILCVVWNGPFSQVYWTSYTTADTTGDVGTLADYESLGTGSPPGAENRLRQSEKIVSSGAHDTATRKKYFGYLGAKYRLPVAV